MDAQSGRGFAKRIIRPSSVQLFPQLTMISLSADFPCDRCGISSR